MTFIPSTGSSRETLAFAPLPTFKTADHLPFLMLSSVCSVWRTDLSSSSSEGSARIDHGFVRRAAGALAMQEMAAPLGKRSPSHASRARTIRSARRKGAGSGNGATVSVAIVHGRRR
jgi:hypothetical protein